MINTKQFKEELAGTVGKDTIYILAKYIIELQIQIGTLHERINILEDTILASSLLKDTLNK